MPLSLKFYISWKPGSKINPNYSMGQTVHHCKLSREQKAYRKTLIIQVKKHKEKGQLRTMRVPRESTFPRGNQGFPGIHLKGWAQREDETQATLRNWPGEQVNMDVFQNSVKFRLSLIFSNCQLFSSVSSDSNKLTALHITWPDFKPNRNSLGKRQLNIIHACLQLNISTYSMALPTRSHKNPKNKDRNKPL